MPNAKTTICKLFEDGEAIDVFESGKPVEVLGTVKVGSSWEATDFSSCLWYIRSFIAKHFPDASLRAAPAAGELTGGMTSVWDRQLKKSISIDAYAKRMARVFKQKSDAAVMLEVHGSCNVVVLGEKQDLQALVRKLTATSAFNESAQQDVESLGTFDVKLDGNNLHAASLEDLLKAAHIPGLLLLPASKNSGQVTVFHASSGVLSSTFEEFAQSLLLDEFRGAYAYFRAMHGNVADIVAFGKKPAVQALVRKVVAKSAFNESRQVEDLGAVTVSHDLWADSPHRRFSVFVKELANKAAPGANMLVASLVKDYPYHAVLVWDSRENVAVPVDKFVRKRVNLVEQPAMLTISTDKALAVQVAIFGEKEALQRVARSLTRASAFSEAETPKVEMLGVVQANRSWEDTDFLTFNWYLKDLIQREFPDSQLSTTPLASSDVFRRERAWDSTTGEDMSIEDYAALRLTRAGKNADAVVILALNTSSDVAVFGPKQEVQALIRFVARTDAFESSAAKALVDRKLEASP